jgi:hypothetical protein
MNKRLIYILIPIVALVSLGAYTPEPSHAPIRIYATGGDITPIVDRLRLKLIHDGVLFAIADKPEEADVTINLMEGPGIPVSGGHVVGYSHAITGTIDYAYRQDEDGNILLHEILHCAGAGHESDPKSVMYWETEQGQELRPWHIEELRGLAGITPIGRARAQIRMTFLNLKTLIVG